jgi:hypothetical protein
MVETITAGRKGQSEERLEVSTVSPRGMVHDILTYEVQPPTRHLPVCLRSSRVAVGVPFARPLGLLGGWYGTVPPDSLLKDRRTVQSWSSSIADPIVVRS